MAEGTLVVNAKKQIRIKFTNSKGKEVEMAVPDAELSASLKLEAVEKLNGRKVEFDEVGGQPKKVRPVGEPFMAAASASPASFSPRQGGESGRSPKGRPQPELQSASRRLTPAFHNPYNFVPAPPRKTDHPELGDHQPFGHHVLHPDRFTGVIRVKMKVITPLLIPDAANAVDIGDEHMSFPVRLDTEGKPYVPPTSVKGMIRSAYEAVTNSRLAVFPGHDRKLAYRMATQEGLSLVPARVENGRIVVLPGTSTIGSNGPQGPMYAAWLPRYSRGKLNRSAVRYPSGQLPAHRDEVECWIELIQHWRWDRRENRHKQDFQYWRVRQIVPRGQPLGPQPSASNDPGRQNGRSYHQPLGQIQRITGFVCITNPNIDPKHDERVFFTSSKHSIAIPVTGHNEHDWETLILNYQQEHEEEIRQGRPGPPALSHSVWSRQIVGINGQKDVETELSEGTLLYAQVQHTSEGWQILGLYPVNISRKLYEVSPLYLLPDSLRPANALSQLSPADRVFGWVNQQGHGAYKGNVRIGPVTCSTPKERAIENFGTPGLPLAILGQPKPQQARFYVAASPNGEAQRNGLTKEQAGYYPGKGLRGRKVYPHHKGLPEGHWDHAMEDRTQQAVAGHFQEYRRPRFNGQEQRDNQNRSIQGWVKPGTEFIFDIHVTNLSKVELGALLWLLSLPENRYHRFGGGKPLGFGSVRLEIDEANTRLYDGLSWKQIFSDLEDVTLPSANIEMLVQGFQDAVKVAYGGTNGSFEQVPFIAAFLRMATGHPDQLPTHYPRARQQEQGHPVPPHPEGKAYEWFVENDRTGRNAGPAVALPDLATDHGLPMLDASAQKK